MDYRQNVVIFTLLSIAILICITTIVMDYKNNESLADQSLPDEFQILTQKVIDENGENLRLAELIIDLAILAHLSNDGGDFKNIEENLGYVVNNVDEKYVFIYELETGLIRAHPTPELINQNIFDVIEPNKSQKMINSELVDSPLTIITYDWINPQTNNIETKITVLQLEGEYVFGSGFFEK